MPMKELSGELVAKGLKAHIVVSRFNDFLTKQLLSGAIDCLVRHGASENDLTVVWVPGANEIPLAASRIAKKGGSHAILCLGVVIQGATPHGDLINSQVSRSLANIGIEHDVPVINALVAANNLEQAIERCGTKAGNKGWSGAMAAIEMGNLFKTL
jgi:6,7-dimethyl-8-ribityllumazine synthase